MITKDEMIPILIETYPDFAPAWQAFLEEWNNEEDLAEGGLPIYFLLSDLARHIEALYKAGNGQQLTKIFGVVERWHVEGDHYVQEAATVGLLEDLQNSNIVETIDSDRFVAYLGLETRRFWYKVIDFWTRGIPITDI